MYMQKCLIIYTSLALILVGMAGATYAITATDADQYVTRSQYAVDMAYLQNKLDEAEAGLLVNINRFRSTDVKMVTWDTPTRQAAASGSSYYNQGKTSDLNGYSIDENGYLQRPKYSVPYVFVFLFSLILTLITISIMISKNKMIHKALEAREYVDNASTKYTNRSDHLITTHTTHHIITSSSSSGGGGFHSSGGSSGGGHSSGGGRHG